VGDRRARFLVADARRLPFAGGRFDAVDGVPVPAGR
jgi:ubiquinone/menaquinone biosynthesis C-methylase UbiE